MGQPPVPGERTNRVKHWFAGLSLAQIGRLVVLLVLAATAAFGGLDTVDKRVTEFKPGEEFGDGEFTLTVERARFIKAHPGTYTSSSPPSPKIRYARLTDPFRAYRIRLSATW